MPETFQEYIAQERERLSAEREAIFVQQQELKQKLSDILNGSSLQYKRMKRQKSADLSNERMATGAVNVAAPVVARLSSRCFRVAPLDCRAGKFLLRWGSRATSLQKHPSRMICAPCRDQIALSIRAGSTSSAIHETLGLAPGRPPSCSSR